MGWHNLEFLVLLAGEYSRGQCLSLVCR